VRADLLILLAAFAAGTLLAELAGARNLGAALAFGQLAFGLALVLVLVRRPQIRPAPTAARPRARTGSRAPAAPAAPPGPARPAGGAAPAAPAEDAGDAPARPTRSPRTSPPPPPPKKRGSRRRGR
jgi:hypothetical protein